LNEKRLPLPAVSPKFDQGFDQAAATAAEFVRFLRQPSRPNAPKPVAKSGCLILKSETYNFHRLDLSRHSGFNVTIYDEDGLKLAATMPFSTPCRGLQGSAKDRAQQG